MSCPSVCGVRACICASNFEFVLRVVSGPYVELALFFAWGSGSAWYFDVLTALKMGVYSACVLGLAGMGLRAFGDGVSASPDRRWRFRLSSLTNSSIAVIFVFASS